MDAGGHQRGSVPLQGADLCGLKAASNWGCSGGC